MKFHTKAGWATTIMILLSAAAISQDRAVNIAINKTIFAPRDSIVLDVQYTDKGRAAPSATLFMMAVNGDGMIWEKRWPILDGYAAPAILVPDSMPNGRYRLYFLVLQNFFTINGKVITPSKLSQLKTTLLVASGDYLEKDIPVEKDGSFEYRNVLFEKEATISFRKPSGNNDDLNISIETALDSVFMPAVTASKDIYIGKPEKAPEFTADIIQRNDPAFADLDSLLSEKAYMLDVVVIEAAAKSRAEKFNEKYSSGLFKAMDERVIDMADANNGYGSALQYLTGRVAGLRLIPDPRDPTVLRGIWRNSKVVFYLDEMRVDAQMISTVAINDIAIIKTYPPPFFGNPGGDGGAIAVYTKRGNENESSNKHTFRVKGYTPMISSFSLTPDKF